MSVNGVRLDSLIANEFAVELEGEKVDGVFGVRNLITFALDADGNRHLPPFELAKMVQRDAELPFNVWLRETLEARHGGDLPQRNLTVVAVDDGVQTRRWNILGATISGIRYSDFDSGSFEMVAEIFTIKYQDIEEEWPA